MPTARVSPAPNVTSSQVAYVNNQNIGGVRQHQHVNQHPHSTGSNLVQNSSISSQAANIVRQHAQQQLKKHNQQTSYFGFGKRFNNGWNFQPPATQNSKISQTQQQNKSSKPIKSQSTSDSNNSNSSPSSSNHVSLNASSDNDSGSSNSLRFGWSNCTSEQTNGFPNSGLFSFSSSSLSPYQKVLKSLNEDERWQREITLGRRIGFYRFRGEIGNGNFSQVKVALHTLSKEKVAVKILDKSKLDAKTQRMLSREISSMEKLHHPNLVRLFEVIETFSKIYLVIEFASGGELFQKISTEGRFDEYHAKPLFAQIVSAIDHMHQHHIIHRDIKAENVFFADSKTIKVGDFGFSTEIKSRQELLNTFCGSPPYAAPELFSDECYAGPLVDLWALGVLLYFMVTATMPFKAQTVSALKKLILEGDYSLADYLSGDCCKVIRGLLQQDPSQRLSIKTVRESNWLCEQSFPISLPKYKVSQGIQGTERIDVKSIETSVLSDKDGTLVSAGLENSLKLLSSPLLLAPDESEAYKQLKELGISGQMIDDNREKGVRCNIIGTYRIVLHRIVSRRYAASGKRRSCISSAESSQRTSASAGARSAKSGEKVKYSTNGAASAWERKALDRHDRQKEDSAEADKLMKSLKKSNKSIKSIKSPSSESGNNNTLLLYGVHGTTHKNVTSTTQHEHRGSSGLSRTGKRESNCPHPSGHLSNNYFLLDNYQSSGGGGGGKSRKKRWKSRKLAETCSIL